MTSKPRIKFEKIIIIYLFVFLFMGMSNYKLDNMPAERPFFYYHLFLCITHIMFGITCMIFTQWHKVNWKDLTLALFVFILFIYMFLNSFNVQYQKETVINFIHYFGTYFLFMKILYFYSKQKLQILIIKSLTLFTVTASISGIFLLLNYRTEFQFFGLIMTQNSWTFPRIHGFMGDPTSLGGLVGLLIILSLAQSNMRFKTVLILFLVFILILTGSRNSAVSMTIGYVLVVITRLKIPRKIFKVLVALIFSVTLAFLALFQVVEDAGSLFARGISEDNENSRSLIWNNSIERVGNFNFIELMMGRGIGALKEDYRSAFNSILELLHDIGLFGVLTLITIVLLIFARVYNQLNESLLFVFFYIMLFNQFIHWLFRDTYGFVTLGVVYLIIMSSGSTPWSMRDKHKFNT